MFVWKKISYQERWRDWPFETLATAIYSLVPNPAELSER